MKKSNQRIHKKAEQKKPMEKDTAHNNLQWTIKKRANIKKKKNKADDKKKVHRSVTHYARCRKSNQNAAESKGGRRSAEGARFLQERTLTHANGSSFKG